MRASSIAGLLAALLGLVTPVACARTKVACVGDSITYGHGLSSEQTYPTELQTLLGWRYRVRNLGHSGASVLENGDEPYRAQGELSASDAFVPDIVVILLGTNDGKPQNWSHASEFDGDYADLVRHYRGLGATVFIALPPPVYDSGGFAIDPTLVNAEIVPRIRAVADAMCAPVIDVFAAMSGHREWFQDDVHPTADGAQRLARTVHDGLLAGAGDACDTAPHR